MVTNLIIPVFDNNVAFALTKLKKRMNDLGVVKDMKRHSYYLTPSEARRLKSKVARAKARKAANRRVLHADAA